MSETSYINEMNVSELRGQLTLGSRLMAYDFKYLTRNLGQTFAIHNNMEGTR